MVTAVGGAESVAAALCAAVTVGTRLAAAIYRWELPTAQRVATTIRSSEASSAIEQATVITILSG